jgi:vancomycin resistance protein VanJ
MKTVTSRKTTKWLLVLTLVYGVVLATLTMLNLTGADRFWFGALNLYLPQIVWTAPGILLVFVFLRKAVRWVWAPLLCLAWVLGPIMGFCWSTQTPEGTASAGPSLRIMSWNVKHGSYNRITQLVIADEIREVRPDVVLLQDADGLLEGPIGRLFAGWNVTSAGQYVIASRFPLSDAETRPIPFAGEDAVCLRCLLRIGPRNFVLYDAHFESPRWGLNAFRKIRGRPWFLPEAIREFDETVDARLSQAEALSALVGQEHEPAIVAGDLNSPETSLSFAVLREAGLHDAFGEGGRGYGYTYGHLLLRHRAPWFTASWMRLDHIMIGSRLQSYSCRVGTKRASEHRPVIADVVLKAGTQRPSKD